jgi:hypothetical protein
MHFTVLALDARSGGACGSAGRIGNLFERGANGIVQKFEAFRLRTHGEHVGGLAGQVEQSIADAQEHLFQIAPDGREPRNLAGLDGVLALLAPTLCSHKARALLGELTTGSTSATGGDRAQVCKRFAAHVIEIVFAIRLPRDHPLGQVLIKLGARAANVRRRLSYRCHFTSNPSVKIQPKTNVARSRNPQMPPAQEGPEPNYRLTDDRH